MLKRPKPGETEEDLLREQEEFLASEAAPSVKLIKMTPPAAIARPIRGDQEPTQHRDVVELGDLPGQFSHTNTAQPQSAAAQPQQQQQHRVTMEDIDDPEEAMDIQDCHITKVLTEIVERDFQTSVPEFPEAMSAPGGFPKVMHRGNVDQQAESESEKPKKKMSLFARQFAKKSPRDFGVRENPVYRQTPSSKQTTPLSAVVHERMPQPSSGSGDHVSADRFSPGVLVSGSGLNPERADQEREELHHGNVDFLTKHSEQEILDKRSEMLQTIDPSFISWLEQRQKKPIPGKATPDTETSSPSTTTSSTKTSPSTKANTPTDKAPRSDLPVRPKKGWVHMDKIEYEKLAWMKDLPPPKSGDKLTGKPIRFDFDGKIVTSDAEVPVHLGLHHHGDEPDRAGYTLEELFMLARSSNLQQRTIALITLSKLIRNARGGEFAASTSVAVIPALLEGGLLFIVRWALDDSTENPLAAAVTCLHSLLVSDADEAACDQVFSWHHGHEVAALTCVEPEQEDPEGAEAPEETKKTDADLLKEDVIKGVLRMSLLPRLRYLLTRWRPAASVVLQILDILTRIARHSAQAAYQICQCSGLLECVVTEFLPTTWEPITGDTIADNYGYPVSAAIKLVRVIATAGRHMAASMISDFDVMSKLTRYIVQAPSGLQLPSVAAEDVYVESLRTWRVFAAYGLATQQYKELYEVLMQKVIALSSLGCASLAPCQAQAVALINVLEAVTTVAAVATRAARQQLQQQSSVSPAVPDINWSHVTGLFQPLEVCMERCLLEFTASYFEQQYELSYPAACVEYVATYLSHVDSCPGYSAVSMLQHLEDVTHKLLLPLLHSQAWGLALRRLREHSVLLYPDPVPHPEQPANLPDRGSTLGATAVPCPLLTAQGTSHFVAAVLRLLWQVGRLHKGLVDKVFQPVLQHEELVLYLRRLCQLKKAETAANPFAKFENQLQFHVLTMAKMAGSVIDSQLYHQSALSLMVHLQQGEEYIAHSLLSSVLFNAQFVSDLQQHEPAAHLAEQLQLSDAPAQLSSATQQQFSSSRSQLQHDVISNLTSVRTTYLTALTSLTHHLNKSRNRIYNPLESSSLLTGDVNQLLVPVDWIFLPILELYSSTLQPNSQYSGEASIPPAMVAKVTNMLRWVYLLEEYRPASVLSAVPLGLKLSRLLCTFLAGSDLFLDGGVHMYLAGLLKLYCKPVQLDRLDLTTPIPGIASFYDLYVLLLDQYEAVSYGDSLFACYVMLPLQQKHDVLLRKAVWGEHAGVLRAMFLPIKEVTIPLERFLEPEENNVELLRLYVRNLLIGGASPKWCPLLYLVAVHHTNRFVYTQDGRDSELKTAMCQQILSAKNELMRQHVVYYKKACVESKYGMELYDTLPPHREQWLGKVRESVQ